MYFVNLHTASGKFIWHFLTCHSTITKTSSDTSNFMSTTLTSSFSKYFQVSVPETEERELLHGVPLTPAPPSLPQTPTGLRSV